MSGTPRIASPGNPPLLWSDIEEAFRAINQNFNELYATIQADGSTQVVNFSQLYDDVSPAIDATYELGDFSKSWKKLNLTSYSELPGNELNGLWLGLAHVIDDGTAVVLPPDSRVGEDLIIDPENTFFKFINVDDAFLFEADGFRDTLNLYSGTAINIVAATDDFTGTNSITFNNTGVTSLATGSGISISDVTGDITLTNTGVLTLTNGPTLPSGLPAGSGISASSSTGNISLTNTGVIDVQNGFGITVSRDNATGIVTVTNSAPAQVAYRTITVAGSSDLVADTTSDTLVVEAGYGMIITTTEIVDDTLVLAVDQNIDITGSVFANDSSIIVDSIDQKVYADGGFFGDLEGDTIGYHTGDVKGSVFGDDSTKIVDAVENKLYAQEITTTNGFITDLSSPIIRGKFIYAQDSSGVNVSTNGFNNLVVLETSVELQNVPVNVQNNLNVTGTLNVGTIDTIDSSAITVVPPVNFNTDVNFENELFIQNSRVIAIAELQGIVAASTDFANFQARIAAL